MSTAPNVTIIPAKVQTAESRSKYHQLRVAAYCRVSTAQEEQQNSYQVQIAYYTDLINRKKEWTLAGIFADERISGTQTKKRTEFNRMIRMCRNKKIDLVTDHHEPIIDRDTYNRVQQELARRSSKRKVSDKTITEQGKYSSTLSSEAKLQGE